MSKNHNIIIITESYCVTIIDNALKTLQIVCGNETHTYSPDNIDAVLIKTMDTGPGLEDMYAEIHTNDTLYIILSESSSFKDIILDTIQSIVPINLELFIEASMYHFNKTFVLYRKEGADIEIEDSDEKRIAIVEACIQLYHASKHATEMEGLAKFTFAMLSFCPMYLLYGRGEHHNMLVNLSAISEKLVPIYTSLERCPKGERFEKRKLPSDVYIKLLARGGNDAMVNFNTDCQLMISSEQLRNVLLPLILLREAPANQESSLNTTRKKGFLERLFDK